VGPTFRVVRVPNMDELENLLSRYHPAGPPPELRDRVRDAVRSDRGRSWREWLPALAAAAAGVFFHVMASGVRSEVSARTSAIDESRAAILTDLAEQLGGDDRARAEAERIVAWTELKARLDAERGDAPQVEVPPYE
jgi:hypothetical protein